VDIGINYDDFDIFVIEFNEYSSNAGSELFCWIQDGYILNNDNINEKVEFRYKDEFDF
jgi:hypothetical protein